ncbi:hypothetical protein TGARI_357350 [Toxoplasma gondii ARI]|uniref:Uncharacterized protein n=1 Tax=Toxoplasma gondii ARI TaxID=1074872 RepID=A0A139XJN7_TOXGO|nr:hypothetical protein TGARI_357350 [Toxoplasma gondii ARI]
MEKKREARDARKVTDGLESKRMKEEKGKTRTSRFSRRKHEPTAKQTLSYSTGQSLIFCQGKVALKGLRQVEDSTRGPCSDSELSPFWKRSRAETASTTAVGFSDDLKELEETKMPDCAAFVGSSRRVLPLAGDPLHAPRDSGGACSSPAHPSPFELETKPVFGGPTEGRVPAEAGERREASGASGEGRIRETIAGKAELVERPWSSKFLMTTSTVNFTQPLLRVVNFILSPIRESKT